MIPGSKLGVTTMKKILVLIIFILFTLYSCTYKCEEIGSGWWGCLDTKGNYLEKDTETGEKIMEFDSSYLDNKDLLEFDCTGDFSSGECTF